MWLIYCVDHSRETDYGALLVILDEVGGGVAVNTLTRLPSPASIVYMCQFKEHNCSLMIGLFKPIFKGK